MNQNLEIMLTTLSKQFPLLDSIESKVANIKERIFLVQKTIADRPQPGGRGSEPAQPKPAKNDTMSEMETLKAKLMRR
jgi:hypothetical protein